QSDADFVEVPSGLLPAGEVGDVKRVDVLDWDSQRLGTATGCGPDIHKMHSEFRDGTFAYYELPRRNVTIGYLPAGDIPSLMDRRYKIATTRERIKTDDCQSGKTLDKSEKTDDFVASTQWQVEELTTFKGRNSVGFSADIKYDPEFHDAPLQRHRYRAYRVVESGAQDYGPLVFVWIETDGDHTPSVRELKRLLDAQSQLTQQHNQ